MDLSQNENRNQKLILPILLFLLVLALGILGSVLYFQSKNAKIQDQVNPIQQPQNKSLPVPPNVVEPPNEEKTPVPPNVTEPSKSPDKIPSSNNEKIPPPLP